MDKSVKAANAAEKRLHKVEAALAASPSTSKERALLAFAVVDAEQQQRAALRAETVPRVTCSRCQCKLKPGELMIWQWLPSWYHRRSVEVCLRCDHKTHKGDHAVRLAELDQQPCEICARTMYLDGYHRFHARPVDVQLSMQLPPQAQATIGAQAGRARADHLRRLRRDVHAHPQ